MHPTRRLFLLTIGKLAGLGLAAQYACASICDPLPDPLIDELRKLVGDRRHAQKLGRSYLALHPHESDLTALSALLSSALTVPTSAAPSGAREALWPAFEARVRGEFAAGDTVQVNGWILARTEARLCALCA